MSGFDEQIKSLLNKGEHQVTYNRPMHLNKDIPLKFSSKTCSLHTTSVHQKTESLCPSADKSPKVSPSSFIINTLSRLLTHKSSTEERIKSLQKKKYKEIQSTLTDRPSINPKSKSIYPYTVSPLYIRSDLETKEKESRLKKMKENKVKIDEDEFIKECTFEPRRNKSTERSHMEIVEDCYKWSNKRKQELKNEQERTAQREMDVFKSRPKINKKSRKLAEKVRFMQRSHTPIFERLCLDHRATSWRALTPMRNTRVEIMSENSRKIIENKGNKKRIDTTLKVRKEDENSFFKFHELSSYSKTFKVNSSRQTTNRIELNVIKLEKLQELLSKTSKLN